jgi:hypothetical protein
VSKQPEKTLEYWTQRRTALQDVVEQSREVKQFQKDYFNSDIGNSFSLPNGVGVATLPPSYHVLGASKRFRELEEAEQKIVELGGSLYE